MTIIKTVNSNNETIMRKGLSKEIIKRKTKADTFSGFLLSSIKKARDDKNWETAFFLEEIYKKFKEFNPNRANEIEIIEGWKGKDKPDIFKSFNEDFIIITHLKDKNGEIKKIRKEISKDKVNKIKNIVSKFKLNTKYKCYSFAEPLGFKDWKELWKERNIYFSDYYYPVKILESLGLIEYSGRGDITRLK